jgi:pimeloyl-ACP methyl ester carboxylesterase
MKIIAKDGVPIAFDVSGHGRPVVLLHGYLANRRCWHDLRYADALVEAGRQCVLIDARGHGESGKPEEADAYAQHTRAGDVIAVLDRLGIERADIFGFSMGGWIGIGAAQTHPERIHRLVTIGAHGFAQSMQPFRDAVANDLTGWIAVVEAMLGRGLPAPVRAEILTNDLEAARACVACDRENTAAAGIDLPMLAMAGQFDPLHDEISAFAETVEARFMPIKGRNHITSLIAIRTVIPALVDFLKDEAAEAGRAHHGELAGSPL